MKLKQAVCGVRKTMSALVQDKAAKPGSHDACNQPKWNRLYLKELEGMSRGKSYGRAEWLSGFP